MGLLRESMDIDDTGRAGATGDGEETKRPIESSETSESSKKKSKRKKEREKEKKNYNN